MRGVFTATAVLGVLAIGGLPALALTLAADETAPDEVATTDAGRPGPPPWAQGRARGHDDDKAGSKADKDVKKAEREAEKGERGRGTEVPPGWGRHHQGRSPHGWAVRDWAHCLADAAKALPEGEELDPQQACGGKPESPGKTRR
jgi:hypothetical protein